MTQQETAELVRRAAAGDELAWRRKSTGQAAAASRELVLECSTISKFADVVIGALMTEAGVVRDGFHPPLI